MSKEKKKAHWGWLVVVFMFFLFMYSYLSASKESNTVQEPPPLALKQPNIIHSANQSPTVSLYDDDAIIAVVGKPVLRKQSEKEDDYTEDRYFFKPDKEPNFQIELNPKRIVITWHLYADNPKHAESDEVNRQLAKKVVVALLGNGGEKVVNLALEGKSGRTMVNNQNVGHFGALGFYTVTIERS
jgi:hypothetical protein